MTICGAAKKVSYKYMGIYNSGLGAMSTLITVVVLLAGVGMMLADTVKLTDLITFLLYINNFTDPVKKLVSSQSSSRMDTLDLRDSLNPVDRAGYCGQTGCGIRRSGKRRD